MGNPGSDRPGGSHVLGQRNRGGVVLPAHPRATQPDPPTAGSLALAQGLASTDSAGRPLTQASARGVPGLLDSPATHIGAEMLLWQWEYQTERKIHVFDIDTTFRRPKYPLISYDVLHVADVLSRFPFIHPV